MRAQASVVIAALLTAVTALPPPLSIRATCPAGSQYPVGPGTISPYGLVPISKSSPDRAYGYVPVGVVIPGDVCTIVDLKIPDKINGELTLLKTCTLSFSFPTAEQAAPKKLKFSGPGHFTFTGYLTGFGGDQSTTYNKQPLPGPSPPFPPPVMVPGNTYTITDLPCLILPGTGGQTVSGALCSDDTALEWEQTTADGNGGCPVGFFVVVH